MMGGLRAVQKPRRFAEAKLLPISHLKVDLKLLKCAAKSPSLHLTFTGSI
jgi:hypothetical protein